MQYYTLINFTNITFILSDLYGTKLIGSSKINISIKINEFIIWDPDI